jgi:hypothetical protein
LIVGNRKEKEIKRKIRTQPSNLSPSACPAQPTPASLLAGPPRQRPVELCVTHLRPSRPPTPGSVCAAHRARSPASPTPRVAVPRIPGTDETLFIFPKFPNRSAPGCPFSHPTVRSPPLPSTQTLLTSRHPQYRGPSRLLPGRASLRCSAPTVLPTLTPLRPSSSTPASYPRHSTPSMSTSPLLPAPRCVAPRCHLWRSLRHGHMWSRSATSRDATSAASSSCSRACCCWCLHVPQACFYCVVQPLPATVYCIHGAWRLDPCNPCVCRDRRPWPSAERTSLRVRTCAQAQPSAPNFLLYLLVAQPCTASPVLVRARDWRRAPSAQPSCRHLPRMLLMHE